MAKEFGFGLRTVTALLLLGPLSARAESVPPDAGQLLERSREPLQVEPLAPPRIDLPAAAPAAAATDVMVPVRRLYISGASLYPLDELHALVADAEGRTLSFAELQQLAARITRHYQAHGYLLARAYLPAQEIRDGWVTLAVLEGQLEQVVAEDTVGLSSSLERGLAAGLPLGRPLHRRDLERAVLLYDSLPGVAAQARLRPGAQPGGTVVVLATQQDDAFAGELSVDNHGDRYTGAWQGGLRLEGNNLRGGDQLALRALSTGDGRTYGRLAYDFAFDGAWRMTLAGSSTRYELGEEFESLEADGRAHTGSVELRYPLLLRPLLRLNVLMGLDHVRLSDRIGLFGTERDKDIDTARLGLALQGADAWRGQSALSLQVTAGYLEIHAHEEEVFDAATVDSAGGFAKLNVAAERWQALPGAWRLRLGGSLQQAFGNLTSAQRLPIGGANGVRAYPPGEAQGDNARLLTLELHRLLATPLPGQLALVPFADYGYVRFNHTLWPGFAGDTTRELAGAGLGLDWRSRYVGLTAWQAWPLTDAPATAEPDRDSRFWVALRLLF